jgi:hypothetical protein
MEVRLHPELEKCFRVASGVEISKGVTEIPITCYDLLRCSFTAALLLVGIGIRAYELLVAVSTKASSLLQCPCARHEGVWRQ